MEYTLEDPDHGTFNFTVLAWEDAHGCAKFDPFTFEIPLLGESAILDSKYIQVTNPGVDHDVEFKVEWKIGDATGHGDVVLYCEGDQVEGCQPTTGHTASFFHFGFANGFKGLEVGGDGFSISVTGSLGYSGTEEAIVCKCCPDGHRCPE
jgi:hypothetical protein